MCTSTPNVKTPPPAPKPAETPVLPDQSTSRRTTDSRRRGRQSTILTGNEGVAPAEAGTTAPKTLLGQ